MFSSLRTLDATGIGDAKLHCVCCGSKCYVRASAYIDGLGAVVVRFVLPSKWQAAVIGALVDAGFDKASELATQARERRERPHPIDGSDPSLEVPGSMPKGARLSRHGCETCAGSLFYRTVPGGKVRYWCPNRECFNDFEVTSGTAANREGVPL